MIIFAGPSIALPDIRSVLENADVRPPARTGDIYRASQEMPDAIGLIDGFFEGVPAVWHKEILWAMAQGIAVFGASSMGALRAAELHAFGMMGVGTIFEAFRDGHLEDDDEVALRHGPREMNYLALSVPMVNIRSTLERAVAEGVLDHAAASALTASAKSMHFPERSWDALLTWARNASFDVASLEKLQIWLPGGRVDQKRLDAIAMLEKMATHDLASVPGNKPPFDFQHTVVWEDLKRQCDNVTPSLTVLLALDKLRHEPEKYRELRLRAFEHLPAVAGQDVPRRMLDDAMTQFRTEHRLFTGDALEQWLTERGIDLTGLRGRLEQDLQRGFAIADDPATFRAALLRVVKEDDHYDSLMAEAKAQSDLLHSAGFDMPTPRSLGIAPVTLLVWYFEVFCGTAVPNDMDVFLQSSDYAHKDEFEQMMARQYILWQD